ncbi:MAG: amino acid adenylation domain-containing protein, partial [bacterium]|nr:amino acid adenylation domain-containing protein [bacterium]
SYRELNRQANQLAHHLRSLGVGPDVLTGIYLERSARTVVGILGILKAGGAYLPLDLSYPMERLSFMLEDAGAPVLITDAELAATLPATLAERGVKVVCLDRDASEIARWNDRNPESAAAVGAETLAYAIYTSGSTGRPKGVAVSQRAVVRLVFNTDYVDLGPDDRVAQASNTSFDAATFELWGALLHGGRLVGISKDEALELPALAAAIEERAITALFLTTALFNQVAREAPAALSRVRQLLFGGEAVDPRRVRELLAGAVGATDPRGRYPGRLLHVYGPTESTTFATWQEVREVAEGARTVPIGGPLANTELWVLDRGLMPVPVGAAGELVLAGDGLARGYLSRPALTAERFVPNPFGKGRLYRTGDLVRFLPDGAIEFLGRRDDQVKLRGFRIELGEVEAVLGSHPRVRTSAVTIREDGAGGKRLVAFVVARTELAPAAAELRRHLLTTLPDYMVPAVFVALDSLPLTPNGKVDHAALARRALPDRVVPEDELVPPRTPTEVALARIWSRVLGEQRVGMNDNFFELGGDSILSIQVVSGARQEGLVLSPRDVFSQPTLGDLATVVAEATGVSDQGPVTGELPLTPVQRWFFEWQLPAPHHFNQALMLEARERLEPAWLERALGVLLKHHDALRLRFSRVGGRWRQLNDRPGAAIPFAQVDLSALAADRQRPALEAAAAAVQGSLDLSRGPLVRLVLFEFGSQRTGRLQWVIHHLAVDGVSWRILLEDLERVCRWLERDEPVSLPPRTTSFKSWADWLVERAASAAVTGELGFWRSQAEEDGNELPVDHPGGVNTLASARGVTVSLSADETRALLQEVHQAYRTRINDVLLAAVLQAFGNWTGERTLLVDMEGHGREELEELDLSRTVGWFTSIFPVLLERFDDPGDLLKAVKERLRSIPGGGVGYGLLRYLNEETAGCLRELEPARVVFNYLGQLDAALPPTSALRPAAESAGPAVGAQGRRRYLLEINGGVEDGCLR